MEQDNVTFTEQSAVAFAEAGLADYEAEAFDYADDFALAA